MLQRVSLACLSLSVVLVTASPPASAAGECIPSSVSEALTACSGVALKRATDRRAPLTLPPVAAPPSAAAQSPAPPDPQLNARQIRRALASLRAQPLLIAEIQGLESLLVSTPAGSADRPGLLRRLADGYVELEAVSFRKKIESRMSADVARRKEPGKVAGLLAEAAKAEKVERRRAPGGHQVTTTSSGAQYPRWCQVDGERRPRPRAAATRRSTTSPTSTSRPASSARRARRTWTLIQTAPASEVRAFGVPRLRGALLPGGPGRSHQVGARRAVVPGGGPLPRAGEQGARLRPLQARLRVLEQGGPRPGARRAEEDHRRGPASSPLSPTPAPLAVLGPAGHRPPLCPHRRREEGVRLLPSRSATTAPGDSSHTLPLDGRSRPGLPGRRAATRTGSSVYQDLLRRDHGPRSCGYQARVTEATLALKTGDKAAAKAELDRQLQLEARFRGEGHPDDVKVACASATAALAAETAMIWHLEAVGSRRRARHHGKGDDEPGGGPLRAAHQAVHRGAVRDVRVPPAGQGGLAVAAEGEGGAGRAALCAEGVGPLRPGVRRGRRRGAARAPGRRVVVLFRALLPAGRPGGARRAPDARGRRAHPAGAFGGGEGDAHLVRPLPLRGAARTRPTRRATTPTSRWSTPAPAPSSTRTTGPRPPPPSAASRSPAAITRRAPQAAELYLEALNVMGSHGSPALLRPDGERSRRSSSPNTAPAERARPAPSSARASPGSSVTSTGARSSSRRPS